MNAWEFSLVHCMGLFDGFRAPLDLPEKSPWTDLDIVPDLPAL